VHLSEHRDETSAHATWHIPLSHPFEAWGDATSIDGSIAVQQPLIAPLRDTRSAIEVLAAVAGAMGAKGYDLVRHTLLPGLGSEAAWQRGLQSGVMVPFVEGPASAIPIVDHAKVAASLAAYQIPPAPTKDAVEVVFRPCPKLLDGRFANNPWLQELPDPATKIVWDNAALLSKKTADALGVKGGELLTVSAESGAVTLPAWVLPGHADDVISVYMGWGRTHAGRVGSGRVGMGRDVATPLARFGKTPMGASDRTSGGFDVFPLRTTKGLFFVSGAKVARQGGKYELVQTQDHDSMEGRPLALEATYAEYKKKPRFAEIGSPPPSRTLPIWQKVDYSKGHRWGMTIDLNACTGCTACVVACQAENNILIVGKEQVARGRELHWLRIDRYFLGDAEDPKVAHQPVACVHCEEAPCENVCPVNATVHSPEGLNDMAYNRCIGTRYCANNCPYKVRRFNYLDYKSEFWHPEDKEISPIAEVPATVKMQFNPDVTVRMRGVMEKCTYCVQRIQQAKIETKRQGHKIKDGDVVTACQQACPAQAIVFGDLNDTSSEVAKLTNLDRRYRLLAELGTAPRTTYLAKVRNPNEANAPKTAAAERKESAG
jgi:molybdopterin-containing oxidoreductase family iron-sulfur binding subunit